MYIFVLGWVVFNIGLITIKILKPIFVVKIYMKIENCQVYHLPSTFIPKVVGPLVFSLRVYIPNSPK
jgi:hypothetical protein